MMTTISYSIAGAFRAALAASWLVLAAPGAVSAADFDDGFTAYLLGKHDQAFKVWLPLARAGGIEAQFGLGLLFEQGRGVARDLEAAASWYARAAEQGSMRAQTQLGGMYAWGDGVARRGLGEGHLLVAARGGARLHARPVPSRPGLSIRLGSRA
jgi:TPR repeat protein